MRDYLGTHIVMHTLVRRWRERLGLNLTHAVTMPTRLDALLISYIKLRRFTSWCMYIIAAVIVVNILGYFLLPAGPLDHIVTVFYAGLLLIILGTCKTQFGTLITWMRLTDTLQSLVVSQQITLRHINELNAPLIEFDNEIQAIPEGWLYSIGMMNIARRTGPIAFLWKPDVYIKKNNKVESRAVIGEGETLTAALHDAIVKAKEWVDGE